MIGNLYFKNPVLTQYKDSVIYTVTILFIDVLRFNVQHASASRGHHQVWILKRR